MMTKCEIQLSADVPHADSSTPGKTDKRQFTVIEIEVMF